MGILHKEYWTGLPCYTPGDYPDLGTELESPALQVDFLPAKLPGKPLKANIILQIVNSKGMNEEQLE